MSMSPRLKNFLETRQIPFQLITHAPTDTAFNAARAAHIPAQYMVKGVLLRDQQGYVLAAVSATRHLDIGQINAATGRNLELVAEEELATIFDDCDIGAVPALGEAYGIPTVWDEALTSQPSFYLEAGDHCELVRMGYFDFMKVMAGESRLSLSHA